MPLHPARSLQRAASTTCCRYFRLSASGNCGQVENSSIDRSSPPFGDSEDPALISLALPRYHVVVQHGIEIYPSESSQGGLLNYSISGHQGHSDAEDRLASDIDYLPVRTGADTPEPPPEISADAPGRGRRPGATGVARLGPGTVLLFVVPGTSREHAGREPPRIASEGASIPHVAHSPELHPCDGRYLSVMSAGFSCGGFRFTLLERPGPERALWESRALAGGFHLPMKAYADWAHTLRHTTWGDGIR